MKVILYFFLITVAFIIFLVVPFINPILGGFLIAYLFNPLNRRINRVIKNDNFSALMTTLLSVSLVLLLSYLFIRTAIVSVIQMQSLINMNLIVVNEVFHSVMPVISLGSNAGIIDYIYSLITSASKTLLDFIILFIIIFYTIKDFNKLLKFIKSRLGVNTVKRLEHFIARWEYIIESFLRGYLFTAAVTGLCALLFTTLVQMHFSIEISTISFAMNMFPVISAWMLFLGISVYFLYVGDYVMFAATLLFAVLLLIINNMMKTLYCSGKGINPIAVIAGLIGGTAVLGVYGFIAGPILFGLFQALLEEIKYSKISLSL